MKGTNKTQFSNKFGSVLTKFKDNSTVQVGHEQVKAILGQFTLKDIFITFVSKMDNIEQMNEREKKEISKVYITFLEVYKFQILQEQYYQKFMDSLSKKTVGVSDVIAHICKTLLGRIQNQEQLLPFVTIIINIFHNHCEVAKILKQISETISPNIISSLQYEIVSILQEKIGSAKTKSDFLDAVLSLVLCLEEKLQVQSNVVNLLLKYLRNEEWSCRKNCVDIAYALLVINQSISENIHSILKELKYDKIKHVRDSVNNYEKLHQQIFGKEVKEQMTKSQIPSVRTAKVKSEYSHKKVNKSPLPIAEVEQRDKSNSLDKTAKIKQKNENFFKNAKNSDVIKTNEDQHIKEHEEHQKSTTSQKVNFGQGKNFEAYLKNRVSPVRQKQPVFEKTPPPQQTEVKKALSKFQSIKSNKFNYESEFQHFKKKSRVQVQQIKNDESKENISFGDVEIIDKNQTEFSLSYISNKNQINHFDQFKTLLLAFEKRISDRLDKMQTRISQLQRQRSPSLSLSPSPSASHYSKTYEQMDSSQIQVSALSMSVHQTPNQSKYSYSEREAIESNLQDKIRGSIANQNWDEAFTIALTNNKKNILLNLLQRCVFPKDKTVEECTLLQVRKLLGYMSTLKWLKYFLMQREMNKQRMQKLKQDLQRRGPTDNRNYQMMRQILLNEIQEKMGR